MLYHRERVFSSTLSCNTLKEEEKKSPNLPAWGAPFSVILSNLGRAPFNQLGNLGRALFNNLKQLGAHPFQSARQQTTTIYTSPGFFLPPPPNSLGLLPPLCLHS
jgi:hypothetical protein